MMKYFFIALYFYFNFAFAANYESNPDASNTVIRLACDTDIFPTKSCFLSTGTRSANASNDSAQSRAKLNFISIRQSTQLPLQKSMVDVKQVYELKKITLNEEDFQFINASINNLGQCVMDAELDGLIVVCTPEKQKILIFITGLCDSAMCRTIPFVLKKVN